MTLNELIEKIKLLGSRTTKTRKAVLECMFLSNEPMSSSNILSALKNKKILVNRTTVYRELIFLMENGLVREVKLIGKPSLFELSHEHRHHLICIKCNKIKTIIMDNHLHEEEKKIMKQEKFEITDHCLEFYGLCQKCQ
jgi:Fe2+ or Zn2+ uptake regulation protein